VPSAKTRTAVGLEVVQGAVLGVVSVIEALLIKIARCAVGRVASGTGFVVGHLNGNYVLYVQMQPGMINTRCAKTRRIQ